MNFCWSIVNEFKHKTLGNTSSLIQHPAGLPLCASDGLLSVSAQADTLYCGSIQILYTALCDDCSQQLTVASLPCNTTLSRLNSSRATSQQTVLWFACSIEVVHIITLQCARCGAACSYINCHISIYIYIYIYKLSFLALRLYIYIIISDRYGG